MTEIYARLLGTRRPMESAYILVTSQVIYLCYNYYVAHSSSWINRRCHCKTTYEVFGSDENQWNKLVD